jgi:ADP-ribosylglycohydrolase
MRTSAVGWVYDELDKTREVARWVAEVSHNHPEGVKGAEATATAIWMARNGFSKDDIAQAMVEIFDYDLSKSVDELRPLHKHDESCQDSLPKALVSFYESMSFEDAIRNAVSLGGDADTIAAITGSIAEAFYGVPRDIEIACNNILGENLSRIVDLLDKED